MRQSRSDRPLSRRSLLAGLGASTLGPAVASARAHPTPDPDGTPGPPAADRSTPRSTPSDFAPLGHVHVTGTKEVVFDRAGETAYLATTDGFTTVDVRDPREPRVLADRRRLLADRERGPLVEIHDVDYREGRLLVVGPADPVEDALRAAVLYDVSDPADPQRLAVHETAYPIHNATLGADVAYLTGNDYERNALVIVDLAGGTELGRWSIADEAPGWLDVDPILWVVHDVTVRGDLAFLAHWDAGTWILDVSDPTAPTTVARVRGRDPGPLASLSGDAARREQLELPGNDHYAAPNADGTLLGVGLEAWDQPETDADGGPGGLELWDVATPASPERIATIEPPSSPDPAFDGVWTSAHNFAFHDDRLYTSWYRGGVRVYDVSDPNDPTLLASWRDESVASFWAARVGDPGSYFVAGARENFGAPRSSDDPITGALYTFPDPSRGSTGTRTGQSGFGALAGLAGAALGGWYALRRAGP